MGEPVNDGQPLRVALVGCGNISTQYLASLPRLPNLRLVSVTDRSRPLPRRVAAEHGVPARSLDDVLADGGIDVILNLTPPQVHAPLTVRALEAGKHVYLEKPFAVTAAEAETMLAAAAASGGGSAAPRTRCWAPASRPPAG